MPVRLIIVEYRLPDISRNVEKGLSVEILEKLEFKVRILSILEWRHKKLRCQALELSILTILQRPRINSNKDKNYITQ
jgi:hypothetical protein